METPRTSLNPQTHRDLPPEVFTADARQIIDWVANYLANMDQLPVLARTKPGEVKQQLPRKAPWAPEPFAQIFADFEKIILPGITHWNHPRFFAYFSITGSAPGILGELLASALNVNAMLWKTSPAATELEEVVLDWLRQMVGLPKAFFGVINDTASVSTLCALAAAREAANLDIRPKGMTGRDLPTLCFYSSAEAHSSVEKAAIVLGIGRDNFRAIPSDTNFRMDLAALREAIATDLRAGRKPIGVIATLGTTSTTSIDPVQEIGEICRRHQIWLHVDAAYGGSAAVLPEIQEKFAGWELADSIVINPHKWMFTPIDCSILFCRRPEVLRAAFSLVPEYLRTKEQDEVTNLMDYGVALGRRFRALKFWLVLRTLGLEGIQAAIREHLAFAQKLQRMLEAHPDFELLAPVPFSTLVFRFAPKNSPLSVDALNQINEKLLEQINQSGQVFLSHTKLGGKFGIRLAIGNLKTRWEDVALAWEIIQTAAQQLQN